ncbi:MAG: hypothetical protein F4X64_09070 [Chloroflexi bacterium]|nr:hypothetical protein [Chloroflexota bacterium]
MLRIGWFSTGRGEGSRGLLQFVADAILQGRLNARIEFVFSNRERGEAEGSDAFFQIVRSYGLPLVTLSSARFRQEHGGGPMSRHREGFDRAVMELLEPFEPDVCALAGYMLICSGEMCRKYPLLNLHGALPDGPTGTWQSVIWELIASGATRTGAMIHLATEEVDRGPVLSHCELPIVGGTFDKERRKLEGRSIEQVKSEEGEENGLFQLIRAEGYRREPYLLLATLRAVAEGRVKVRPGEALDANGNPLAGTHAAGFSLTAEIEAAIFRDAGFPLSRD